MKNISRRDVLKGIGGATGTSLFANTASAEEPHNKSPNPEYEKEELSNNQIVKYTVDGFHTQTFQSMYDFLLQENHHLNFDSIDGYTVKNRVGEHILLQIPYLNSSEYCSIRIYEDRAFVRAMVSENDKTELYVSNPNVISEMERDVVSVERLKEARDQIQESADQYTTTSWENRDCSIIDLDDLCPYLSALGALGTAGIYFTNPGAGVVATVTLADFVAAGCTASAIVEDWDGDKCNHENIEVCTEYTCSSFFGVVTCNPVPDIYIRPAC